MDTSDMITLCGCILFLCLAFALFFIIIIKPELDYLEEGDKKIEEYKDLNKRLLKR